MRRDCDTGTERLRAHVEHGVGWIAFDNPAKHNALTADMFVALGDVAERFAHDHDVRVVVVRGAGDGPFASGADIGQLDSGELNRAPTGARAPGGLARIEKPVIAMIRGWCLGGGVMVALDADLRIAAEDAVFGIPAAKLGVGYPPEAVSHLVDLIGPAHTAEMLFSAHRLGAREAHRLGLVNRVVAPADLGPAVEALAADIAALAPLSHVAHKRTIRATRRPVTDPSVLDAIAGAWRSEDCAEGRRAFLERRPAVFRGR